MHQALNVMKAPTAQIFFWSEFFALLNTRYWGKMVEMGQIKTSFFVKFGDFIVSNQRGEIRRNEL